MKSERMGNDRDGGWEMCVDPQFVPKQPCLIYSFGIGNQWDFDDACDLKFQCVHRAFDPSINTVNQKRGKNIFFYAEGLAGKDFYTDELWRLSTLSSLRHLFKETETVVDYLKIDIEHWEWESLQTAIDQGALNNVKQLGVVSQECARKVQKCFQGVSGAETARFLQVAHTYQHIRRQLTFPVQKRRHVVVL